MGFSQTLEIKSSGSESIIRDTRAGVAGTLAIGADKLILRNKDGNEPYLEANDNGSVKLYHDFFPRFETSGIGITVLGSGTDSTIDLSTDDYAVRGKIFADNSDNIGFKDKGGDWNVKCLDDAAVELYYNTTKRIETLVDGGKVTGDLEITEKVGIGTDDPILPLHISSTNPAIRLTDENQATDNKNWNIGAGTSQILRIQAINDAGGGGGNLFDFYRVDNNVNELRGMKSGNYWFVVDNLNTKSWYRNF